MRQNSSPNVEDEPFVDDPRETPGKSGAYLARRQISNLPSKPPSTTPKYVKRPSQPTIMPPPDRGSNRVVTEEREDQEALSSSFRLEQLEAIERLASITSRNPELMELKMTLEKAFPDQPIRVLRELEAAMVKDVPSRQREDEAWAMAIELAEGDSLDRRAEVIELGRNAVHSVGYTEESPGPVDRDAITIVPPRKPGR